MLLLASLVLPSPPLLTAPALANGRLPRLYMGEGYATDQPIGTGASAAAFGAETILLKPGSATYLVLIKRDRYKTLRLMDD